MKSAGYASKTHYHNASCRISCGMKHGLFVLLMKLDVWEDERTAQVEAIRAAFRAVQDGTRYISQVRR